MASERILVVDDEEANREFLYELLTHEGYEVETAADGFAGLELLQQIPVNLLLSDLKMPEMSGVDLIRQMTELSPLTVGVIFTGYAAIETAVEAIKAGAYDYIPKPFRADEILMVLRRALEYQRLSRENIGLRKQLKSKYRFDNIVSDHHKMQAIFELVEKVSDSDSTILIYGESGTGKELIARALHYNSYRQDKPLIPINCGAIPEELLESELFGYEKGAFTGAASSRIGRFELAHGGTLFLDEIGDMPQSLQAKLLRFLQERTIERIGGRAEIPVDVRVVCATNKNLRQAMASGAFREDLYYRISEITIDIPPLREREGGRLLLAQYLLNKFAKQQGRSIKGFTEDAHDAIEAHAWPGNVREMENKIKAAVIMAEGKFVTAVDLGLTVAENPPSLNLRVVRQNAETHAIRQALVRASGNISRTAELLGVTRPTLYDLMAKYGIRADDAEVPTPEPAADARK